LHTSDTIPPCEPFFCLTFRPPPRPTLFPYTTLFRSRRRLCLACAPSDVDELAPVLRRTDLDNPRVEGLVVHLVDRRLYSPGLILDRKSTRLNSSHGSISYAVFCLKKKKKQSLSKEID